MAFPIPIWGFIKKPRPFNHIFGGDRILRAWYRGIKNAGPGRKGERKTHHITSYHHITMEFGGYLLNVAKNPMRARARKGEAQGVLSYWKVTGIFDNPHIFASVNCQDAVDLVLERLAAGGSRLSAITEELLDRCNAQKSGTCAVLDSHGKKLTNSVFHDVK